MGKTVLFLAFAVLLGGSFAFRQVHTSRGDVETRQTERQTELLAREIAQTGYNAVRSKARHLMKNDPSMDGTTLISTMGGPLSGTYQNGSYSAWVEATGSASFRVVSVGSYGDASYRMGGYASFDSPISEDYVWVKVEFLESMADHCSAVYLERVTRTNNGHGNNEDGVDSSNPGASKEGEDTSCTDGVCEDDEMHTGSTTSSGPELVYAPGNNRDGAEALFAKVIKPGTLLNFILAVDADNTCEERGNAVSSTHSTFDYVRPAFAGDVTDFGALREGNYVMLQERPGQPGVWRIAFEDLIFSEEQLQDVKDNGYGDATWDEAAQTYGGAGWVDVDGRGYWDLSDYGSIPDFSDQVIEIQMIPLTAEEKAAYLEGGQEAVDALHEAAL